MISLVEEQKKSLKKLADEWVLYVQNEESKKEISKALMEKQEFPNEKLLEELSTVKWDMVALKNRNSKLVSQNEKISKQNDLLLKLISDLNKKLDLSLRMKK